MKIKSNIRAGSWNVNRCATLAVKTGVKAGAWNYNRCESPVSRRA